MNIFLLCTIVSAIAIIIQISTEEELVKISATLVLLICLFLGLLFAPWLIKLLMVLALPLSDKYISLILISREL